MPFELDRPGNRSGIVGLSPMLQKVVQSRKISELGKFVGDPISIIDPQTDVKWGYGYQPVKPPNSYFDYYFAGQDINVFIDGVQDPLHIAAMPILEFGFGIQQQKQPVYGWWSYKYDAVMKGTRIVNGMFRIATTSTNYMTDQVSRAAESRVNGNVDYNIAGLDIDEQNITQYWDRHFTENSQSNNNQDTSRNLFNTHPPFNFVIVYGIQSVSVDNIAANGYAEVYNSYKEDNALMTDINERLVEADPIDQSMRFVIENVELTGMQTEYSPDGQVCSEVYSFFARDMYSPSI